MCRLTRGQICLLSRHARGYSWGLFHHSFHATVRCLSVVHVSGGWLVAALGAWLAAFCLWRLLGDLIGTICLGRLARGDWLGLRRLERVNRMRKRT